MGNVVLNPEYLTIFTEYLIPTLLVVFFMLKRTFILRTFLYVVEYLFPERGHFLKWLNVRAKMLIHDINSQEFVYFTKQDDVATLNKVMKYIEKNEATRKLRIVAVLRPGEHLPENLKRDVEVLDRAYPQIHIHLIEETGTFGPEKVRELAAKWKIPTHFMFIASPGDRFPYRIEDLGEVRLII